MLTYKSYCLKQLNIGRLPLTNLLCTLRQCNYLLTPFNRSFSCSSIRLCCSQISSWLRSCSFSAAESSFSLESSSNSCFSCDISFCSFTSVRSDLLSIRISYNKIVFRSFLDELYWHRIFRIWMSIHTQTNPLLYSEYQLYLLNNFITFAWFVNTSILWYLN